MRCGSILKATLVTTAALLLNQSLFAAQVFGNIADIQAKLGFNSYYSTKYARKPIKVAVLDHGFGGYKEAIDKSLPTNTIYHPGPTPTADDADPEIHGRIMAEIFYQLVSNQGKSKLFRPAQLHLYNVSGFSNFKAAIDDLIANKIDLVLYSEVWQLGSNWDGKGFINAQVNRATQAGVIWVNAAGNFAGRTYDGGVALADANSPDKWVALPDENHALKVVCNIPKEQSAKLKKCGLKAYLSWNDFKNKDSIGTDKDLDFALTDDLLNIVQSSALKQTKLDPSQFTDSTQTSYPRESIDAQVDPGTYYLRVKRSSDNFSDNDVLRITVDGDFLTVPSGQSTESILNPADNASVIVVGASDSDRSSSSRKLRKPNIFTDSAIILTENGQEFRGSSNSAAIVAAGIAMLKTLKSDANATKLLTWVRGQKANTDAQYTSATQSQTVNWNSANLSTLSSQDLRFSPPTGLNCFPELRPQDAGLSEWPQWFIDGALQYGGQVVNTDHGLKIILPFDPLQLAPGMQRVQRDDAIMLQLSPGGPSINLQARQVMEWNQNTSGTSYELFQAPTDYTLCGATGSGGPNSGAINDSGGGNSMNIPASRLFSMPQLNK